MHSLALLTSASVRSMFKPSSCMQTSTTSLPATTVLGQQTAQDLNVLIESLGTSEKDAEDLLKLSSAHGRPSSVQLAAFIFFEERSSLLMCLSFLLQVFLDYRPASDGVVQTATTLLRHLVDTEGSNNRPSLLSSLCTVAKVCCCP
jgi:hypothetical protein